MIYVRASTLSILFKCVEPKIVVFVRCVGDAVVAAALVLFVACRSIHVLA